MRAILSSNTTATVTAVDVAAAIISSKLRQRLLNSAMSSELKLLIQELADTLTR
jgi:hypothetical protein